MEVNLRVISKPVLIDFYTNPLYKDSEEALKAWHDEVSKADWNDPHEIKLMYKSASIVGNKRVVFNICGNKYRLIVSVSYRLKAFYIKFIGTHKQYDAVNAETIDQFE